MGAIELLLGLGVMTVPIAMIGGLVAWAAHAQKRRAAVWTAVAAKLGLESTGAAIHGLLEGQAVRLFTEQRGSGKNKSTYTVASGLLVPGFDLGLSISKHGTLSTIGEWMGMTDIEIGEPGFDGRFVIRGDEAHRVRALLAHPLLRQALDAVCQSAWAFSVGDAGFKVECRGASSDPAWLEWALRMSAQIARLLDEGRHRVPCASPLQLHRDAWVKFAQATGMIGLDTPLCMSGRMEGASVAVYAVRSAALAYGVEVFVRYDRPLGLGLLVRPQGTLDALGALFGGQDIAVGDAAFDPRFVVKASAPGPLPVVLDADVRTRMVDLADRIGTVQVRDDGVSLRAARFSEDPAGVPWLVAQARSLADRIAENYAGLGSIEARGPYR